MIGQLCVSHSAARHQSSLFRQINFVFSTAARERWGAQPWDRVWVGSPQYFYSGLHCSSQLCCLPLALAWALARSGASNGRGRPWSPRSRVEKCTGWRTINGIYFIFFINTNIFFFLFPFSIFFFFKPTNHSAATQMCDSHEFRAGAGCLSFFCCMLPSPWYNGASTLYKLLW